MRAFQEGRDAHEPWDTPDTICGGIEIPDPAGSRLVLEALRESNGGAVAASDEEILEAGTAVASRAGPEMGATCAAAAAGAWGWLTGTRSGRRHRGGGEHGDGEQGGGRVAVASDEQRHLSDRVENTRYFDGSV